MKNIYTDFYKKKKTKDEAPAYIAKEFKLRVIDGLVENIVSNFGKITK